MDNPGSQRKRWSTGIAFQLLLGLGVIVVLILVIGISTLLGLHQLMNGLQTVVDQQVAELVLATQVDRQSATLVAEAPTLALADNEARRRYSNRRLQDQLQLLQEPSQRLYALGLVDRSLIDEIGLIQAQLNQNIDTLDKLVRQRNEAVTARQERITAIDRERRHLELLQQHLLAWQQRQRQRPWNLLWTNTQGSDLQRVWQWLSLAQEQLALEGIILGTEQEFRLGTLDAQYQALQQQHRQIRQQLSATLQQWLPDAHGDSPNPVTLQRQVLVQRRHIQGTLVQSNHITDTLLAATANLVSRVTQAIDDQNHRNRTTIDNLYRLGLGATVVAMGLALMVLVFIDQRILRRLRNFQQSLRTLTTDPGKAHAIPVTGSDEIASMARSFEGLLAVIQSREQALRENEERLQTLARQDALTGLPNRHYFFEVAQQEIHCSLRRAEPLSVLMMDVDHFKTINDTYGHAAGDQVLSTLSRALMQLVRGQDVVGRLGGEEFGVLLPGTDRAGAMEVAERLRQGIAALRIVHAGQRLPLTVSIGVAQYSPGEQTIDHALNCADHGLYSAKNAGRNRIMCGPD